MMDAPAIAAAPPPGLPSAAANSAPALVQHAVDTLKTAVQAPDNETAPVIEERSVFRPDSWLIQRCWEALADACAIDQALRVARLAERRQPLASVQCLYRLSRQDTRDPSFSPRLTQELARLELTLFTASTAGDLEDALTREHLLYAAAAAASLGERYLALACLERIDQLHRPWDNIVVHPDQRTMLAKTILLAGLQPLTKALIMNALRRFSDAGAQFVLDIMSGASAQLRRSPMPDKQARTLAVGVNTFRNASLSSLHGRRLTAIALSQAALVNEVLTELTAIANIQAARRESGLSLRKGDPSVLRQVKRPTADADVDFQVYTLREAVRAMPIRQLSREDRIELASRLAMLGIQSDGWTAAGAAATLVDLGAIKYAVEVVEKIPIGDPTRAEGFIALVRGLLTVAESDLAEQQVRQGLAWARSYPGRNPERALIWGLAEVYLERREPRQALALLDTWEEPASFFHRLGRLFRDTMSDDELRNNGLRLRALLLDDTAQPREVQNRVAQLCTWAPRLLDGEALLNFLLDGMMAPLLASGRASLALSLLSPLREALRHGSGEKHAMRVKAASTLLANELTLTTQPEPRDVANGNQLPGPADDIRLQLEQFLIGLWQNDAQRGLWQTVHGIEGSLPLVIAIAGPEAVVTLAQAVATLGAGWV